MKKYFIFMISMLFLVSCNNNGEEMKTVGQIDLDRFMGDWYVIATIPNFIEKNASNGVESYVLNEKGEVNIQYTFQKNGKPKTMNAKGFIQDTTNSFWKVQFIWPIKLPYLVIDLADDYSYTVVGVPNKKFVWIMARQPILDDNSYKKILENLSTIGYNTDEIKKMGQNW